MASLAESTMEGEATRSTLPAIKAVAKRYASDTGARVGDHRQRWYGVVDTGANTPGRRSFATRPEFRDALRGDVATGTRHSRTLGYDLLYVAVPIASGGTIHGALRISYPTSELDGGSATTGSRSRASPPSCWPWRHALAAASRTGSASRSRVSKKPPPEQVLGDLAARAPVPEARRRFVRSRSSSNEMVARVDGAAALRSVTSSLMRRTSCGHR